MKTSFDTTAELKAAARECTEVIIAEMVNPTPLSAFETKVILAGITAMAHATIERIEALEATVNSLLPPKPEVPSTESHDVEDDGFETLFFAETENGSVREMDAAERKAATEFLRSLGLV